MADASAALSAALAVAQAPLERARLAQATVEVALAAGDLEAAVEACRALEQIADVFGTSGLEAAGLLWRGAVALEQGPWVDPPPWLAGAVVVALAFPSPELVTHLILMEGVFYLRIPDWEALKAILRFQRAIRKRPDDAVTDFMRLMFAYRTGETAWDEPSEEVRRLLLGDAKGLASKLRLHRYGGHMEWLKTREVADCPVPMTWVGGEESIEFFQKMHSKLAAANANLETVMIPGENHAFPVVDPTAFASVVRDLMGATARTP